MPYQQSRPISRRTSLLGFSLLEMLVVLILLSSTGLALYDLMQTELRNFRHIDNKNTTLNHKKIALNFTKNLNPMHKPEGEKEYDGYKIRWHSELLNDPWLNTNYGGTAGNHKIALYQLFIEIIYPNNKKEKIELICTGYDTVSPILQSIK